MPPATPVVSYARISADTHRDEHGVQDQHALNRPNAGRYGWTVVHDFTDNDKSAAKVSVVRDDFENMLRAIRSGKLSDGTPVRGVVVTADDRLARRPGDYERFVEAITYQDGRVYAGARGPKDLYSEDVESMGLFGAVISKMEVRKMQRRMRNSHRARASQGMSPGGTTLTSRRRTADVPRRPRRREFAARGSGDVSCWQITEGPLQRLPAADKDGPGKLSPARRRAVWQQTAGLMCLASLRQPTSGSAW